MRQGRRNKGPVVVLETTEEEAGGEVVVANVPAGSCSFRLKPKNIRRVSLVAMNHAHVKAEESLKTAVVIKDTMWVLEAAKITRQCVVSRAAYQTQT